MQRMRRRKNMSSPNLFGFWTLQWFWDPSGKSALFFFHFHSLHLYEYRPNHSDCFLYVLAFALPISHVSLSNWTIDTGRDRHRDIDSEGKLNREYNSRLPFNVCQVNKKKAHSHARKKRKIFIVINCECQRFKTNTNYEHICTWFSGRTNSIFASFKMIAPSIPWAPSHLLRYAFILDYFLFPSATHTHRINASFRSVLCLFTTLLRVFPFEVSMVFRSFSPNTVCF